MPTIGEQLKQAREARRLSIQQVVQAIRIRDYYLEAMEADDFSSMPSAAQARGFFRSYVEYLGLNADELIDQQQRNESTDSDGFSAPTPPGQTSQPDETVQPESQVPAQPPAVASEPEPETPAVEIETPEPEEVPSGVEKKPVPPAISQLIFFEIGHALRQRRELLSLTLDEIERHTRVRKHYLEKIEAGNYDELPSPVQARGMLSNYASFLDMDAEALLLRFADALQARRLERQSSTPKSSLPRPRMAMPLWLGRFISPDLLFGGGMILLLFVLTLWGAVRIFSGGAAPVTATQGPSISDVLLASPVATLELTEARAALPTSVAIVTPTNADAALVTATDTQAGNQPSSTNVRVTLSILERTFIRVTVDGKIQQEGRVAPGAALTFVGTENIEVLTGSGSAVQVLFNQQNLGSMGNFGEVVDRIYTLNGVQTPTSTPSPTVTATERFQKTPSLTPTITPTAKK